MDRSHCCQQTSHLLLPELKALQNVAMVQSLAEIWKKSSFHLDEPRNSGKKSIRYIVYIYTVYRSTRTLKDSYFIFLDIPILYLLVIWLVVLTILKNMSSSMGRMTSHKYEMDNNPNLWNHQQGLGFSIAIFHWFWCLGKMMPTQLWNYVNVGLRSD